MEQAKAFTRRPRLRPESRTCPRTTRNRRQPIRNLYQNLRILSRNLLAQAVAFSAALMFERLILSRFMPSMRTSFVTVSRLGECTSPTS